ncbi:hypothetical protein ACFV9W_04735 [Streptomyces sp. NPDC059897]|uniref:hypothetical protein n=1 Tax=Streptomyces sp. NPDC059897 TaxID=3346994 RepID=UPI00364D35B1
MKRGLKLTAVATMVVIALTGFTTGKGGKSKSRSSGSGGCSSSSQKHDSSSGLSKGSSGYSRQTKHRTPTTSSSASSPSLRNGTVRLIKCADARQAYATVEVTNPNSRSARFDVHASFLDASGASVNALFHKVTVPANGRVTARVPVGTKGLAAKVDHCDIDRAALVQR